MMVYPLPSTGGKYCLRNQSAHEIEAEIFQITTSKGTPESQSRNFGTCMPLGHTRISLQFQVPVQSCPGLNSNRNSCSTIAYQDVPATTSRQDPKTQQSTGTSTGSCEIILLAGIRRQIYMVTLGTYAGT